jgi:hypothetical protein
LVYIITGCNNEGWKITLKTGIKTVEMAEEVLHSVTNN